MRAYRYLLSLFPAGFRDEYGGQMRALLLERLEGEGPARRFLILLDAMMDLLLTAFSAHCDAMRQDLRYGVRTLARSPGFSLTAIAITAIGIGATTAAFSLADHVLLRPLPFADANHLVELWEDQSPMGYRAIEPSPPNYRDWKNMSRSFESVAAYHGLSASLQSEGGEPQLIEGASVSADLFPMLGAHVAVGRPFGAADDRDGAPGTLILSDRLWHSRFGGDPGIIGRKVRLDGEPFVVIGVMPGNFFFPRRDVELWTATRFKPEDWSDRTNNWLHVVAKLRRGIELSQAASEMRVIGASLQHAYPKENAHVSVTTELLGSGAVGRQQKHLLWTLLAAAASVLAIACFNLANLLLARAFKRQKEMAVRAALGAGRERLVRQMLTESLLLATIGGAAGILLAFAIAPLMKSLVPLSLPISAIPSVDGRVLLFSTLLTVATALAFGAFPAARLSRDLDAAGLREGARSGVGGHQGNVRKSLVAFEVAASVALLVCAGLLARALVHVREINPGFRAAGVLTARTSLPMPKYVQTSRRNAFYAEVLENARRLPGVSGAAYISFLPMIMRGGIWPITIPGQSQERGFSQASMRFVTPGFFSTLGIPQISGRDVAETDRPTAEPVAVVSRSFEKRYWPGESALGKQIEIAGARRKVVGVVGDIHVRGLERNSEPQVYLPYRQQPDDSFVWYAPKDLVIRSSAPLHSLIPELRKIVARADAQQPLSNVQAMSDIVEAETLPRTIQLRMIGTFAGIAFLLAGVGIYGLLAFTVSNRRQEIGVRIALGAKAKDIVRSVLGEATALSCAGIFLGLAAGYGGALSMHSILAGVDPTDWQAYVAGLALAAAMVICGSLAPALRAVRTDPLTAIRVE